MYAISVLTTYVCLSLVSTAMCELQCAACRSRAPSREVLSTIAEVPHSEVCVWSTHDNTRELQVAVVRELTMKYKAVVVLHSAATIATLPDGCSHNVLLFRARVHCRRMLSYRLRLSVSHSFYVLFEEGWEFEAADLTGCSEQFGFSRVLFVSMHSAKVFALSSPVSFQRTFDLATLSDILKPVNLLPNRWNGIKVNVATFNCSPFVIFDKENYTEYTRITGIEWELLKVISGLLNFSINLVELKGDKRWGAVINGSWNGGIGLALADGTADIGVCNIWNSLRFYGIMDFGPPLNVVTFTFVVPRPRLITHSWRSLVAIFTVDVWACTLLLYLLASASYWLFCNTTDGDGRLQLGACHSLLTMFGILTLASFSTRGHGSSTRQLVLWWCLFVVLLTAVFSSSIAARLARPRYEPRIDTIEQLVDQGFHWYDRNYTAHDKQGVYFNLANAWQRRWEQRYRFVRPAEAIQTRGVAFPIQRWGRYLVFLQLDSLGLDYERDLHDMRVLKETTSEIYVSFGFAKRSAFYRVCQHALQRMSEAGLVSYWARKVLRSRGEKYSRELLQEKDVVENHPKQLSMANLISAFCNLFIGLLISFVFFLKELHCRNENQEDSNLPFIN